jgi:hypothetical protein
MISTASLASVMREVDKPFLITFKAPAEAIESAKKRRSSLRSYLVKYGRAIDQICKAHSRLGDRMLVIRYKSLSMDLDGVMSKVTRFVGLQDVKLALDRYNERLGNLVEAATAFDRTRWNTSRPRRSSTTGKPTRWRNSSTTGVISWISSSATPSDARFADSA